MPDTMRLHKAALAAAHVKLSRVLTAAGVFMTDTQKERAAAALEFEDRAPCHRCGKRHLSSVVWLELDSATGYFHEPGDVSAHTSQGLFRFGATCARKALAAR